jgi:predicted RNA binding protein YcfA (HicA-like mRNA interferase family)
MAEVPRISGLEAIRAFEQAGFEVVRVNGSHHILKKSGHTNRLSIPVHGGRTVGVGLLRRQIAAAGLTVEQFNDFL